MSIASYRRNEARGVTGPFKPTCFPASLEQLSPYSLPPHVYGEYTEFVSQHFSLRKEARERRIDEYMAMIDEMVEPLGGLCSEDLVFKRAATQLGLKRIVNKLLSEEFSIALDIRTQLGVHTVGLLPVEDEYFTLVSNYVPRRLGGVITLDDIMPCLNIPKDRPMARYPLNDANIVALPPTA